MLSRVIVYSSRPLVSMSFLVPPDPFINVSRAMSSPPIISVSPPSHLTFTPDIDVVSRLDELKKNLGHTSSTDQWTVGGEAFKQLFTSSTSDQKTALLHHLSASFAVDKPSLDAAIAVYQRNNSATHEIRRASTPLYQLLFQSVGNRFGGVKCICDLRAHLLSVLEEKNDVGLRRVEESAKELLTMWFCLSNLTLERLTWQSPADILHKVAKYEAVHPVAGITDLRRRVGAGRRCFLFTHEAMPREPLVVVHVALVRSIADNLQEILKADDEERMEDEHADTAIYYSISSTQKGLAGIDLGNLLIKGVVEELERDQPKVKTHSTLSPIPGFRAWVLRSLHGNSEFGEIVDEGIVKLMKKEFGGSVDKEEATTILLEILSTARLQTTHIERVKGILMRLCAVYLLKAKRNGWALNAVANFHVRNGAEVHRLNWAADSSPRGMERSFGMMVNYKYNLESVHHNSEQYTARKDIAVHPQVSHLLND